MDKNDEKKRKPGFILGYRRRPETPKIEARPEYRERKYWNGWPVVFVLGLTVAFVTASLVFAVYYFFHGSRIAKLFGMQYTENLKEAYYQLKSGKNLSEIGSVKGYEGWRAFHSDQFDFYYPRDWQIAGKNPATLRKFNRKIYGQFYSLAVVAVFHKAESFSEERLPEFFAAGAEIQKRPAGDSVIYRSAKIKSESGLLSETIVLAAGDKAAEVEIVYYVEVDGDLEKTLAKILDSAKIK